MDERWTPGQGDDQPSPPPDPADPLSGDAKSPQERETDAPPGTGGDPNPPAEPGDGDVEESNAGEDPTAGTQGSPSPRSPYTIPGATDTPASSWGWTSTAAPEAGWQDPGPPLAPPWSQESEPPRPATHAGQPESAPVPSEDPVASPPSTADGAAEHAVDTDQPTASWQGAVGGPTDEPPHSPEEPTPHTWEHTEYPTYQPRGYSPEPPSGNPTEERAHAAPEHTEEPPPRVWEPTDEGGRQPWEAAAPPTGQFPTASAPREPHEPGATDPPSLEDTASFATPRHEPYVPQPPQHAPDPSHRAHEGAHSPDQPWEGDTPSAAPHGGQAPAAPPPPPGEMPWAVGPPASEPRPYGESVHMGQEPDQGPPPHGPYAPADEPAGAATASYRALGPEEPMSSSPEQETLGAGDDAPPRRSRKGLVIGIVSTVVALALLGGGISWYVLTLPQPEETADSYAAAWGDGDHGAMAELSTGGDDTEQSLTRFADNLGVTEAQVDVGEVSSDGDTATAPYEVTLSLKNAGDWGYEGELPLTRQDGEWLVEFNPEVMHPELGEGQTLTRVNAWGERGHILAADGTRLDTDDVGGSVGMIVGQVGAVEEEDLQDLGPAYGVGDPTGVSGLQRAYEERLAGEAGTAIHIVDEGDEEQGAQEDPTVVDSIEGSDGEDVTTSLDPRIQSVAAQAVVGESDPTALTAIRPSTGEILAVANAPGGYNRAFEGQYAPGSSFKIVSYQALMANGLGVDAPMHCPENATVGGWEFKNAGDAEYGEQSVTEAFATSCNTALVQEVANRLDSQTITAAAERFGMNSDLDVGVPTTEPSFPAPENTTMVAAQSIGQGQILTSPLHMATIPAAVADGSWRSPTLVNEPEMSDQPEPTQLGHAEQLRPMMREVVTNGTADEAGFNGEVHGKTGSAEFGTAEGEDDELDTHAWFVGYKDDIAFSVVVEGGGGGGSVAAPIGADFVNAL